MKEYEIAHLLFILDKKAGEMKEIRGVYPQKTNYMNDHS